MSTPELLCVVVTLALPDWFAGEEADWSEPVYYPKGHRYAGSYSHTIEGNWHEDKIFKTFPEMDELCTHPQGKWISLGLNLELGVPVPDQITLLQLRLKNFLAEIEGAKSQPSQQQTEGTSP